MKKAMINSMMEMKSAQAAKSSFCAESPSVLGSSAIRLVVAPGSQELSCQSIVGGSDAPSGSDSSASRPANHGQFSCKWAGGIDGRRTEELEAHVGDVGGGQHCGQRAVGASGEVLAGHDGWRLLSRLKPHGATGAGSISW